MSKNKHVNEIHHGEPFARTSLIPSNLYISTTSTYKDMYVSATSKKKKKKDAIMPRRARTRMNLQFQSIR